MIRIQHPTKRVIVQCALNSQRHCEAFLLSARKGSTRIGPSHEQESNHCNCLCSSRGKSCGLACTLCVIFLQVIARINQVRLVGSKELLMRLIYIAHVLRTRVSIVIFVFWMLLAMCVAVDDQILLPSFQRGQSKTSSMIAKTVVSSTLRIVFVVGLEGTGHHFFEKVFKSLFKQHPELALIDACFISNGIYMDKTLAGAVSTYREFEEAMRAGMKNLAKREEHVEAPATIVIVQRRTTRERKQCSPYGEMSFPDGHGPNKALKYPDIQKVAQLAEEEGVDLRIVYLQRSAKSILVSSTIHRDFQQ